MSNKKRLPLKTILDDLKDIADEVRTDPVVCERMRGELAGCGYDWFGNLPSISDENYNEDLKEQVMKVLAFAVNETIRKKVDLGYGKKVVNTELHQLLNINKDKSLDHYFIPVSDQQFASMSSPLDMAKYLRRTKTKSAPHWLVRNIIQHQFDIRWNTRTINDDPDDYTFYKFCDNENTTGLLKYIPRQAHVKATLYKECRRKSVNYLRGITKENLCPTVYMRIAADEWISWRADKDEVNDVNINTHLSWINSSIRTFITENADEQNVNSIRKSLEKPTLYWAVLNDDSDFMSGGQLRLKEIGQTQVYVGRANNGIQGRWLKDKDNHCKMMKTCLDNVCAMTTYDPLRLEGIQLVDARLTLAKIRRERTALFVIKTFGDDVEQAQIAQEKAEASLREAKASLRVAKTERHRINSRKKVAKRQEGLDKAIDDTKRSKSKAEDLLTKAERLHLSGKRVNDSRKNIIPYDDYDMKWTPKDMGYGMNK